MRLAGRGLSSDLVARLVTAIVAVLQPSPFTPSTATAGAAAAQPSMAAIRSLIWLLQTPSARTADASAPGLITAERTDSPPASPLSSDAEAAAGLDVDRDELSAAPTWSNRRQRMARQKRLSGHVQLGAGGDASSGALEHGSSSTVRVGDGAGACAPHSIVRGVETHWKPIDLWIMSANAAESQSYIESDTRVSYIVSDLVGALQSNILLYRPICGH